MAADGESFLTENLSFIEDLHRRWLADPVDVPEEWRRYFESQGPNGADLRDGPTFPRRSVFAPAGDGTDRLAVAAKQDAVDQLVRGYRVRGHTAAQLNPLGERDDPHPELSLEHYGLTEADLDRRFSTRTLVGPETRTLRDILDHLKSSYCNHVGLQYMHIDDIAARRWLAEAMEAEQGDLTREEQLRIHTKLTDAELFEQFIQKKFQTAKRFSLEGGETLIPLLDTALEIAGEQEVEEVVIGMAHRGRLNVLANIMGKSAAQIFREFEDPDPYRSMGRGDVKYHMGHSCDHTTSTGREIHLSLAFNPSHLEFVNPVVAGRVRAKQDRWNRGDRSRRMGLLIHGDAAFIGQGIVQETLNMSGLPGYRTGGTVHVIVNNQIGFTTVPEQARSTQYASDIAKMLQVPIFHVNGEYPEAVAKTIRIAMDFRKRYGRDVVIDMWCYRKHGHNEGDEPAFTQPIMYDRIRERRSVRESHLENLLALEGITQEDADRIAEQRLEHLEHELERARSEDYEHHEEAGGGVWTDYFGGPWEAAPPVDTSVSESRLELLMRKAHSIPDDFKLHKTLRRGWDNRLEMARGERPFDWGAGEALAFASIVADGRRVRLSGQDSCRGTFSHRHAVVYDQETGKRHIPLRTCEEDGGRFEVRNSPLSEAGVLGFDWGYSLDTPEGLVLWEAQFGDFCNGAQVIIDQFIVASEDKWNRLSGLVMLLPHAFEGQGPEHSSARLERFLSLAVEHNIQVVNLTTPAQLFHCLRRQVLSPWKKPLVVMSPKSLLRHKRAVSERTAFTDGGFQTMIGDRGGGDPERARRILMCSGKIYYDLVEHREETGQDDVHILRLEQLYPEDEKTLRELLGAYPSGTPAFWVQEEPANMGAWAALRLRHGETLLGDRPFAGISRPPSASPATGSSRAHKREQEILLEWAFAHD